jgi:DNA-directed RNA polymerase subunit RPC12/RpoP
VQDVWWDGASIMTTDTTVGYLDCPNCGAEAAPSTGFGCLHCDDGGHEERKLSGECTREEEPLWYEEDNVVCPECGVGLQIVIDDSHAYLREDAGWPEDSVAT